MKAYIVGTQWIVENKYICEKVFLDKKRAEKYIDEQMEGKEYNGMGFYKIIEVPLMD